MPQMRKEPQRVSNGGGGEEVGAEEASMMSRLLGMALDGEDTATVGAGGPKGAAAAAPASVLDGLDPAKLAEDSWIYQDPQGDLQVRAPRRRPLCSESELSREEASACETGEHRVSALCISARCLVGLFF